MPNVLILNLHQKYEGFAEGRLNKTITEEAKRFFEQKGFTVEETVIDDGYEVPEELDKFRRADVFFVQTPVYWMGLPWLGKKYIDELFSGGSGSVTFTNDGRADGGPYGSGGLMKSKRYMLSFTYNCPAGEFDNPDGFFEGLSVDGANIALHKAFQFCGVTPLESFSVHDVYSENFKLAPNLERLQAVLERNFPAA
ncbi:MAG: NAD(P)H-dependent oxidoreductase [Campylobacterales bacterium]|jgi:modulator of drug activity B